MSQLQASNSSISSQESSLSKYNPSTVTYGRMASGKIGFETVGQKEYALEEQKRKNDEAMLKYQKQIAAATQSLAAVVEAQNKERQQDKTRAPQATSSSPAAYSFLGSHNYSSGQPVHDF